MPTQSLLLVAGGLFLAAIAILVAMLFTVEQRTTAIIQRLGKFLRVAGPGLHGKVPFIDKVIGRINLRVQQLDVRIETKTEDNVFVQMVVAVQYYVLPEKVYDAFYKLDDATRQITSFVFDVVRARVPKIKLDDVFEKKDEIADIVKSELAQVMDGFGYGILKALVTDIEPDSRVKESMNEINAAQRMRVAATERGEADRILKVKAAEGDAQSKALQGRGIADQRRAIVAGLRDSVDEFRKSVPGTTAKDVMNLVLMTQYFDMLKEAGASSRTNAILIPHSPGNLASLTEQMRTAMVEADQISAERGDAGNDTKRRATEVVCGGSAATAKKIVANLTKRGAFEFSSSRRLPNRSGLIAGSMAGFPFLQQETPEWSRRAMCCRMPPNACWRSKWAESYAT
jgi:regulator of protease activity HflC (stomatin/prohibitin superfamily)